MTALTRMALRKLGRFGLVALLTVLSALLAYVLNYIIVESLDFVYVLEQDIIVITIITFLVTPLLSWYLVGLFFQIDRLEVKMAKLASIDSLTSAYNRGYFYKESELALSILSTDQKQLKPVVLVLDLDDLKLVNDQFGHAGGDKVLVEFSSILLDVINPLGIVGRLGGDEFGVFFKQINSIELQKTIDRILERVRSSMVEIEGQHYSFTVSIGVSFIEQYDTHGLEAALKTADAALYNVKRSDRNGYSMHDNHAIKVCSNG